MRMKKIYYDSWMAKMLLFGCHTITIGPFVFSKKKEDKMTQETKNHECTHARQWMEITVLSGIILLVMVLASGLSPWWMLLSGITYYLWYVTEWLVRVIIYLSQPKDKRKSAYKMISFEREANENEHDLNYLENCRYFSDWIKYLKD